MTPDPKAKPDADEPQPPQPGFNAYEAEDGWRWRYVSTHNGNILADSGESYEREVDALAGMEAVKLAGALAFAEDNPVTPLEAVAFTEDNAVSGFVSGVPLPEEIPSVVVAGRELRDAQRRFNVADQNLNHATDENSGRFARSYVEERQKLDVALAVLAEAVAREPEEE